MFHFVRLGKSLGPRLFVVSFLLLSAAMFYYVILDHWGLLSDVFFFELRNRIHGLFYVGAIAYASVFFSWRGYMLVWSVAFLVNLPRTLYFSLSTESLVSNLAFWSLPLLAGAIIALEKQWRSRQRSAFADRQRERELYLSRILVAQEEERRRIAIELHDEPLQDLVALAYAAEAAVAELPEAATQSREKVVWIRDQCVRISRELRRISYDLRPSILDELGLVPALRWLVDRTTDETPVTVAFVVDEQTEKMERVERQVESGVFRVVQEALNNIRRHSGATRADVTLHLTSEALVVEVSDNGHGFQTDKSVIRLASEGHLGILGMRERASALGGSLVVRSSPSSGTVITMSIPVSMLRLSNGGTGWMVST